MKPNKAFILAAGFGERMRPLTETCPKPLLRVGGETLLDRALDQLAAFGVGEVVINAHYLAGQIEARMKKRSNPVIHISPEPTILETGAGIRNALQYFGDEPFFVLNGDGYWIDPPEENELERLAEAWDDAKMDILLSLQPLAAMKTTPGVGDYMLQLDGKAVRSKNKTGDYMFNGLRINHPRIFRNAPAGAFSYLDLMDRAETAGRLYALPHRGIWHHLSTPGDLEAVEKELLQQKSIVS